MTAPGPLLEDLKAAMWWHMMCALPIDPSATMRELDFRSLHQVYAGMAGAGAGRAPASRPRLARITREP